MSDFPRQALSGGKEPYQAINISGSNALPTAAPTLLSDAQGRVSQNGAVSVLVDKACTVTIYYWNILLATWVPGSSTSAGYSRAFAGVGGLDYFQLPPKALFALESDTGTTRCWHDGDAVNS
jgi:hypothetical protein